MARLTLALPGEPDTPPPWTPQTELARRLGMAQPSVSRHQKALFEEWAETPWLEQVRDELVELLVAAGRVSVAGELAAILRARRGTATAEPRPGVGLRRRRSSGPRSRPRSGRACTPTTRRSATAARAWPCSVGATAS